MSNESVKTQLQECWRTFDTLVDSQSGGNEAIIRAMDIFAGASGAVKEEAESAAAAAAAIPGMPATIFGQQLLEPMSVPVGNANAGGDGARRAYFRAEEGLSLAREQLARNEETLRLMAEEVERARQCIGACYNTEEAATRQERKDLRARASLQALDRGDYGCVMSPVDSARAMAGLLRMHQSEFEMQETIVCGLGYDMPADTLTAYREALDLRPFMDDRFLSEVQEIRALGEEVEGSSKHESTEHARTGV